MQNGEATLMIGKAQVEEHYSWERGWLLGLVRSKHVHHNPQ